MYLNSFSTKSLLMKTSIASELTKACIAKYLKMLVIFKKIGKHEISIDTKSTNGRSEETFLFLSGVIVA